MSGEVMGLRLAFDRPATAEETAAVLAAIAAVLAEEEMATPAPTERPWQQAARLEGLGLERRVRSRAELRRR